MGGPLGESMASTLLDRLAALTVADVVDPPPGRKAEIAAIRAIFDAYFARLDAALAAHGRTTADRARDHLGAAIDRYFEDAQATAAAVEAALWRHYGKQR